MKAHLMAKQIVDTYFGDQLIDKKPVVQKKLETLFKDPSFDFMAYLNDDNSPEHDRVIECLTSTVDPVELINMFVERGMVELWDKTEYTLVEDE